MNSISFRYSYFRVRVRVSDRGGERGSEVLQWINSVRYVPSFFYFFSLLFRVCLHIYDNAYGFSRRVLEGMERENMWGKKERIAL